MSYVVTFRGHPACPCLAEWLPAYEAELLRRGVIKQCIDIYQLIGGYKGSGGTHTDGGAFDIAQTSDEAVKVARQMGADATWRRPKNWDGAGGIEHTHGVLRGCPHNGPARYQYDSSTYGVDHGRDGLYHGGRGGPDTGPRPLSGTHLEAGHRVGPQPAGDRGRQGQDPAREDPGRPPQRPRSARTDRGEGQPAEGEEGPDAGPQGVEGAAREVTVPTVGDPVYASG